jgi:hypothetical protein
MPFIGSCNYNNKQYNNGTATASPGVYCGGIELKPQAEVTFQPGVYIVKNGPFNVQAQSVAKGSGVVFVFAGINAYLDIRGGGSVDLKAPTTGTYAGFIFVDHRTDQPYGLTDITGGGSVKIEGIVYQPTRGVYIHGNGSINQTSNYFAMVADNYYLNGTGDLYLKTNFAAAGFPDQLPKVKRLTRLTN